MGLLPPPIDLCRFCRSVPRVDNGNCRKDRKYAVECQACGMRGPTLQTRREAKEVWNGLTR